MNRNKKILNATMAAGMAAVLGATPILAATQDTETVSYTHLTLPTTEEIPSPWQ